MSDSQSKFHAEILASVKIISDPAGRDILVLNHKDAARLSKKFNLRLNDLYIAAMDQGIWPRRYIRNYNTLSLTDQRLLVKSKVAIIGAGGLGGHVIQLLARMGIGSLIIVDPDTFDETNLNRQPFATVETLDLQKTHAVKKLLESINPAVAVIPYELKLTALNFDEILTEADIVVDCLDSISERLILQEAAQKLNIPLVHGALAGFEGQMMTIFPGDPGLKSFYATPESTETDEPNPECILGVPAITPSLIGSFQAMEVVKILLKRGRIMRRKLVYFDLDRCSLTEFSFKKNEGQASD